MTATLTAPISYETLHLETSGPVTGRPVLLLHGWGSSAALMRPIAEALANTYRIYNIDMPGHGASPAPPQGMGVPEHAALVHDFLTNEIGQPVTLIGHSNGGRIGLHMASQPAYNHHFNRLVLISPSGITPKRGWKYHVRRTTATVLKAPFQILPRALREFGLDWLRHSLVWKLLGSSDYRQLQGTMRETFVQTVNFHVNEAVRAIEIPTLLFWGDQDTAISKYQMDYLDRLIPDAGLVTLKGAGHYGYLDAPDVFEAATRHFLEHA